jgi:voltage-gated potassium channel
MGRAVVERLLRKRTRVVLVYECSLRLAEFARAHRKLIIVEGRPTDELVLAEAGILRAASVVAGMDSEVDNLLISITCKDMGTSVRVFARSDDFTIANRMRKACVDEVVSPFELCGEYIANRVASSDASTKV